jgi:hypothetical protein
MIVAAYVSALTACGAVEAVFWIVSVACVLVLALLALARVRRSSALLM